MNKPSILTSLLLFVSLTMCLQAVADDSCHYANDGVCDEPNYCDTGTDTNDCSGRRSIESLVGHIQESMQLEEIINSSGPITQWGATEYNLLICEKYFPSLNQESMPIPQSSLQSQCQDLGGCECNIEKGRYQAIAMKRTTATQTEVVSFFEAGPIVDISDPQQTILVGHIHSNEGHAGNLLAAQTIRETIRLLFLNRYKTHLVNDELLNRPMMPFSTTQSTHYVALDDQLISMTGASANRLTGTPLTATISLTLIKGNQLKIAVDTQGPLTLQPYVAHLSEMNEATLRDVTTYIDAVSRSLGLSAQNQRDSELLTPPSSWTPSGFLSVFERLETISQGTASLSAPHLLEAGRAWAWLAFIDARISPILAHQHAAKALAYIYLSNPTGSLSFDQQVLTSFATASAYSDHYAVSLLEKPTSFPEINQLMNIGSTQYNPPDKQTDIPGYAKFIHALHVMEFTPHFDQAIDGLIGASSTNDGLFLDTLLGISSFGQRNLTIKLNRGESRTATGLAFDQVADVVTLTDSYVSNISNFLNQGAGFSLVPELTKEIHERASALPVVAGQYSEDHKDSLILREITHRLIAASYLKLAVWDTWGMTDNLINRANSGLSSLLSLPASSPEIAYAMIVLGRFSSVLSGWQASYRNNIDAMSLGWAKAYPGLRVNQWFKDSTDELAAAWLVSDIASPRINLRIKHSNLFFGTAATSPQINVDQNYLLNFTYTPKWWQTDSAKGDIPLRFSNTSTALYTKAQYVKQDDPEQAKVLFQSILEQSDWRFETSSMRLESLYVKEGNLDKAIEVVQKFIASDPQGFLDLSDAQRRLARHYVENGLLEQAFAVALEASNSGSVDSYRTLIICAILARQFDVAEETITQSQRHYSNALSFLDQFKTLGELVHNQQNIDAQWDQFISFMELQDPRDEVVEEWLLPFLRAFDLLVRFFETDNEVTQKLLVRSVVNDWLSLDELPTINYEYLIQLERIKTFGNETDDTAQNLKLILELGYQSIPASNDVKPLWEKAFKRQFSETLLAITQSKDETLLAQIMTAFKSNIHWATWTDIERPFHLTNWLLERGATPEQAEWFIQQYGAMQTICHACDLLRLVHSSPDWIGEVRATDIYQTAGQAIYHHVRKGQKNQSLNVLEKLFQYADLEIECGNTTAMSAAILATGSVKRAKEWLVKQNRSKQCKADATFGEVSHYQQVAEQLAMDKQTL